jgi:AraC-like DNA-binding protein
MTQSVGVFSLKLFLAVQVFFFLPALFFANEDAASHRKDSLLTLLEISPDRVKSKIYSEMSDLALEMDTSQAKVYAIQAFSYASKFQAPFDLAQSHYRLGQILLYQDSVETALLHFKRSLAIAHESEDQGEKGRAYLTLSGKSLYFKASIYHGLYSDSAKIILSDLLQALENLDGSNEYKMLADLNHLLGQQYFEINIFDKGLEHYHKALEYYKEIDDKHAMALIYMQLSYRVDRATGHEYAQRSTELFAQSGDSLGMAKNLIHISYNARNILDDDMNLKYLQRAYGIYKKYADYPGMVYALFHLATYHSRKLGDSAAALQYLKKGAEIALKHKVIKGAGHLFITLGGYYKMEGQYDSAAYYYHIADSITAYMPGKPERIRYFIRMGEMLNAMGQFEEAEEYLKKALEQAQKIDDWQLINIAYNTLYRNFKDIGNYEKALTFYEQHEQLKNKMINQSTESKIAELQIRYETDKMEHQLEVLEKDREIKNQLLRKNQLTIASISTVLLLILAFTGLIIRQLIKKRRAYNKLMEKNLQLLKCERTGTPKKNGGTNNQPSIDPVLQQQILKNLNYQIKQKKVFLKDDLTLNALAKKCQTNSSYLSKIIHEKYDTNFSGFINELRIKEAQKMMADKAFQSYSIEGIASSVGFKTKSVFNASFKKFTGVTPSYYLEYLKEKETEIQNKLSA